MKTGNKGRFVTDDGRNPPRGTDTSKRGMFITEDGQNVLFTFLLLVLLFALWGFCNGMIDVMDKHFQEMLHLSLAQSAWVQFAHYLGYFLMAMPAGWLATRLGYKGGIIAGLLLVAVGGFWFVPATHIGAFWAFLLGVCIIAAGLTFLETIANPYATVLGPEEYGAKDTSGASTGNESLWIPYAAVAVVVIILAVIFFFASVPDIKAKDDFHMDDGTPGVAHSIWSHPHFVMAVVAQFLYVAAQAGIFSFFINYMTSQIPEIPEAWDNAMQHSPLFIRNWLDSLTEIHTTGVIGVSNKGASNLVSVGLLLFLTGRFIGTALLKQFAAHKLLGLYGAINTVLCLLIFLKLGWLSAICVLGTYFFMSIMFPTIFALGIFGLGQRSKKASSFLVMAIMGGAILPKVMGAIADISDLSRGFIVPMVCFGFIAAYAYLWPRLSGSEGLHGVATVGGH
jgi:FHS family L-fucose permease-like MFS transporter